MNNNRLYGTSKLETDPSFGGFDHPPVTGEGNTPEPSNSEYVLTQSPHHIINLLILLFKDFFIRGKGAEMGWTWQADLTKTNIAFDIDYNAASKIVGIKPIIVLSTSGTQVTPLGIGGVASGSINYQQSGIDKISSGMQKNSTHTTGIQIHVTSKIPVEVSTLSTLLFYYMTSSAYFLPSLLNIDMIENLSLSGISPMRQDKEVYMATISFTYRKQFIWTEIQEYQAQSIKAIKLLTVTSSGDYKGLDGLELEVMGNELRLVAKITKEEQDIPINKTEINNDNQR